MDKNQNTAEQILELVGGKENIKNLFHCMTRLRFNLNDNLLADVEALKGTPGVLGVQDANGEFQVILGPAVGNVYKELIKLTGLSQTETTQENPEPETKEKVTVKSVADGVLNALSGSLAPLVPLFVVVGIFNTAAMLIGPQFLGFVSEDADLYKNFYYVGQAILYFLPILVGYAASRRLGSNTLITMALACVMLYPDFIAIANGETAFTVLGIPMTLVDYNTSVIPIILIAWIQAYVEKLLNKFIPDAIKVIVVPCLTVLIMLPVGLCALGPVGNFIGVGLGQLIVGLYHVAGPLATTFVGATAIISGVFGITRPIFFICLSTMLTNGVEYAYMPVAMAISNWVALGADLGFVLKAKSAKERQLGISCLIALFFGGVSEPSLYGIFLQRRNLLISTAIAGGLAGLYLGVMKVGYYVFGPSNFLNVMGFIGGASSNFVHGCIAAGIGFVSALAATLLLEKRFHNP